MLQWIILYQENINYFLLVYPNVLITFSYICFRSPKQSGKKLEKDERNRDVRRSEGEKSFTASESRRYEKRGGYESNRGGREGFAPRGEPSRRGRGGFRTRGSVGRRVDGYGPPSSKSPFGQPTEDLKIIGRDI